jgi:hypothetical protein
MIIQGFTFGEKTNDLLVAPKINHKLKVKSSQIAALLLAYDGSFRTVLIIFKSGKEFVMHITKEEYERIESKWI